MGLFSESVTTVGTTVTRVLDDDSIPSSTKNGTIASIFNDDNQMIENVMEELIDGLGMRSIRMHAYGRTKYTNGIPYGDLVTSTDAKNIVETVIESEVGSPINIEYYHLGSLNLQHFGWFALYEDYAYNPLSNEIHSLSVSKGHPVYLKNMLVVVTDATLEEMGNGSLDQMGVPPSSGYTPEQKLLGLASGSLKAQPPFLVDATASQDYVKVVYVWEEPGFETIEGVQIPKMIIREESLNILVPIHDTQSDWHHVKYSTGSSIGYWLYEDNTGVYPVIDAVYNIDNKTFGNFFPFAYFRYQKQRMDTDKQSEEFKTTKRLLNYVSMDFEGVIEGMHENPDIADVEQAMMVMAVPADTDDPIERKYLYDFFNQLFIANNWSDTTMTEDGQDVAQKLGMLRPRGNIIIQDKKFKMSLGYSNIIKNKVTGVLGPIGTHDSGYGTEIITKQGFYTTGEPIAFTAEAPSHYYRRQISEVMYEEIKVFGLKMTYFIFENYTTTGDETDKILLIPLDFSVCNFYSLPDKEVLFARSFHYVFNSKVVTKLKWYQTSAFRIILIIIAIIITVVSVGTQAWTLSAAVAAGVITVEALVIAMVIGALKYLIVGFIIKVFLKVVGPKIGIIAAIVAIVASAYFGYTDTGGTSALTGAPWSEQLLEVSTGLTKEIGKDLQDDFADLLKEQREFLLFSEKETKKLDEVNKLLESNNNLSPLIIFGEKPDDFYQRTVHYGNIGVLGLDAVSSYCDVALMLPKLNDTIGDTFYA